MALTEEWFQQVIDREVEDVELVLLEEAGNRRNKILRLYIDHPGGVNHDFCARVSAAVGRALDEVDAFEGAYTLEVSSPGHRAAAAQAQPFRGADRQEGLREDPAAGRREQGLAGDPAGSSTMMR